MKILYLFCLLSLFACASKKKQQQSLWINSSTVNCTGVAPKDCLQIKWKKDGDWEAFYDEIKGFSYQPGYQYELVVEIDPLPIASVPADAASKKYTLVKIISKNTDPILRLNDIWLLEKIRGDTIDSSAYTMEIDLKKEKLFTHGFCNIIQCKIKLITGSRVEFHPALSTRKICPQMQSDQYFTEAIEQTKSYTIENNMLNFFDKSNTPVLQFRKVD